MLPEMFKKTLKTKNNEKIITTMQSPQVPEGLFKKCPECGEILCTEDIISNYHSCPSCGFYFRINARTRINMISDSESFQEWDNTLSSKDPLSFPGYRKKLESFKSSTQLDEAVITGKCTIRKNPVAVGVMDSEFMMGSMGSIGGEKITRMIERASLEKLPVILFCCSGGARMQEGIFSLMQMAKTSQALKKHSEEGLLYIFLF
jgi:acetyl-CoA carboxylase carboxyl transferase subunit beta